MTDLVENPFGTSQARSQLAMTAGTMSSDQSRVIAEVQGAIMMARANPRDPVAAVDRILNACTRPALAEAALYSYAKGGSEITGPSIRLAEAIAQQWGNFQFGIRELSSGNGASTMQSYARDLETNVYREITFIVPHIRHTRSRTYTLEDPREIYEMTANNGARRLRACILAVIPGDVVEAAVAQCDLTLKASVEVTPESIKRMEEAFAGYGVTRAHIEKRIQRHLDTIQPAQVVALKKIYASLRDGMSSAREWFDFEPEESAASKTVASVRERAKGMKAAQEAAQEAAKPTEETSSDAPEGSSGA